MLSYKLANVPTAAEAVRTAALMTAQATARERAHVQALDAWIAGDLDAGSGEPEVSCPPQLG
jgi:hypothetical protein